MKEKILHFRIPINKHGNIALSPDTLLKFAEILNAHLGETHEVIFSPFEIGSIDKENIESFKLSGKSFKDFLNKYIKKE